MTASGLVFEPVFIAHLKQIFENAEFVFEQPEVINEISFSRKELVKDHVLYCGDAAGMITPLCGNGMAMAIRSGKILAECIIDSGHGTSPEKRLNAESRYIRKWNKQFAVRLMAGRYIQNIFLDHGFSNLAVGVLSTSKSLSQMVVASTHGSPF